MTAAVAPMPILQLSESPAEARKRRRDILANQRALEAAKVVTAALPDLPLPPVPVKRRKLNTETTVKTTKAKKPQMKYDPDVPMTKEEAAAWRREQRRKRNRESAAASRQRQRDRITELEVEVEDWKTKFESIMERIQKLESETGKSSEDMVEPFQSPPPRFESNYVSPPSSPSHSISSCESPVATPVASLSSLEAVRVTPQEGLEKQILKEADVEHSDNMISRPAAS